MGVAVSLIELARISGDRGDDDRALDYYEKCIKAAEKMREVTLQMDALSGMAEVLLRKGKFDSAEENAKRAIELSKRGSFRKYEGSAMRVLGMVSAARRVWPLAGDRFDKAVEILIETDPRRELAWSYYQYGKALKGIAESTRAKEMLEKALEKYRQLNLPLRVEMVRKELEGL
jgi:tetratricopeptide (TPR) repeat protein